MNAKLAQVECWLWSNMEAPVPSFQTQTKWSSSRLEWHFRSKNRHKQAIEPLRQQNVRPSYAHATACRKKHLWPGNKTQTPQNFIVFWMLMGNSTLSRGGAGEITQWLNVLAALAEYWSPCPSTPTRQLTTACHCSYKGTHAFSWPLKAHVYTKAYIHREKWNKISFKEKKKLPIGEKLEKSHMNGNF